MEIDPGGLDRRAAYKLMISLIVPRPIAWVSTVSPEGGVNLAPFSYFNGICSHPPILMIAVGARRGERKDTWRNIDQTRQFVVNLVVPELVDAMVITSGEYPPEVDEFKSAGLTPAPSTKVSPPRIAESPVSMECELERIVEVERTALILGKVVLYHVRDDLLHQGSVDPTKLKPVARLGDDFYSYLGEVFSRGRPSKG
ncbi:MAG TPA: flavin reductase family protein [Candidatus Polarisedimenticolia bacterium]|nr:flavin reductase family protein [Candidatus Polarisedimenticolia bacterium]